jgi:hypothetical protein
MLQPEFSLPYFSRAGPIGDASCTGSARANMVHFLLQDFARAVSAATVLDGPGRSPAALAGAALFLRGALELEIAPTPAQVCLGLMGLAHRLRAMAFQ